MITIILLLFTVIALLAIFPDVRKSSYFTIYSCLCVVMIIVAVFRPDTLPDYKEYVNIFNHLDLYLVEPSYAIISKISHALNWGYLGVFSIYAILAISFKFYAINKIAQFRFLSLLIYLSFIFIFHDLIQIRAGVATALFLLMIEPLYQRNAKRYFILCAIAVFFHVSALLFIVLWFVPTRKINRLFLYFVIPACFVLGLLNLNPINLIPIPFVGEKIKIYEQLMEAGMYDKINIFNPRILIKCVIFYFMLSRVQLLYQKDKYAILLLNIYAISIASYPLFSFMPILSNRISELFLPVEIILLPLIVYMFKPTFAGRLIVVLIGLSNLVYFFLLTDIFNIK